MLDAFAFKVDWRKVLQRRVALARVVPAFNSQEQRRAGFGLGFLERAVDQLPFQRNNKASCHGVVISITRRAHAGPDTHLFAAFAEPHIGASGKFN